MTDKKTVETFRVKLGEYYKAEKVIAKIRAMLNVIEEKAIDEDDCDNLYEAHKSLYNKLFTAQDNLNAMIKTLCGMFNDITNSNISPMQFVPYLHSSKLRRLAIA